MKRLINFLGTCLFISIITPLAVGGEISESLQRTVLEYAIRNGNDVTVTKKNTEEILKKLSELDVSPCEVTSEFNAKNPATESQIRFLLTDIVESKLQGIRVAEEMILKKIGVTERLSQKDRLAVKNLAVRVAANSMSITELKEEVIPQLFRNARENIDRVKEVDIKVELLELQLRRLDSICDKVAILWAERTEQQGNQRIVARPNPEANDTEWRSINGTDWEPQAYATSEQLCSNPKAGPTNVVFDTNILTNSGWVRHRHYGDMWIDCSGKRVMVLKRQ